MDMETNSTVPASSPPPPITRPALVPITAIALLMLAVVAGGYFALRSVQTTSCPGCDPEEQSFPPEGAQAPKDYTSWEKPLVAIVLSGQMHGHNAPCGCSEPQYGGLVRRYNFVQSLKAKNWDVVGIDFGELASLNGIHAQNLLKYELSVRALGTMGYRAVGIGRDEIVLGLGEALAPIWRKNQPFPRPISLSLEKAAPGEQYYEELNVRGYEIIETTPKIGVINIMGPDLRNDKDIKRVEKFVPTEKELAKALKAFADAGVGIGVILHHEYPKVDLPDGFPREMAIEKKRKELALKCAKFCDDARKKNPKIPPIQLMMVLGEQAEPPMLLAPLDKLETKILEVGHKGKYVALIGVYRKGKGYELKHENVLMSPEWKTKPGEEKNNAVTALMEEYQEKVKRADMLAKFPRSPHFNQLPAPNQKGLKATFVGSERCADCHEHAFKVWTKETTGKAHHKSTETLENQKNPANRQFDPECMMCHVTGLKHPGGYNDLLTDLGNWPKKEAHPAKKIQMHNAALRGVGCESCHGPGSEHVKDFNNKDIQKLMNTYPPSAAERMLEDMHEFGPLSTADMAKYKALSAKRMQRLSVACMKCHDDMNDVNWGQKGHEMFDLWVGKQLIHHTKNAFRPRPAGPIPAPPAKKDNPPVVKNPMPPPVIEIIPDKKK